MPAPTSTSDHTTCATWNAYARRAASSIAGIQAQLTPPWAFEAWTLAHGINIVPTVMSVLDGLCLFITVKADYGKT